MSYQGRDVDPDKAKVGQYSGEGALTILSQKFGGIDTADLQDVFVGFTQVMVGLVLEQAGPRAAKEFNDALILTLQSVDFGQTNN